LTYVEHWHTANTLETNASVNLVGSYHQLLAAIVFRYFTLESFLNLVGEEQFKCWGDLERLPTNKKLNLIAEKVGLTPDYGKMPWQIEPQLAGIRNKIAHGKNQNLEHKDTITAEAYDKEMFSVLKADWQEYITQTKCEFVKVQLEELMINIWTASGHEHSSLFVPGIQLESAEMAE
jgi:hypothetical protein